MKKLITVLLFGLALSSCGKAPTASALSTTTVTAHSASVTQTFTYAQGQQACAALQAWDSSKTNIQYTNDPGGFAVYLFTAVQITQNGMPLTSVNITIAVSGTTYCSVLVDGGKIVSVQ